MVWCTGADRTLHGYALLHTTPDGNDTIDIQLEDHGYCTGDSFFQCMLSTNLQNSACLGEGDAIGVQLGGSPPSLLLFCGCYTPDDPCIDAD